MLRDWLAPAVGVEHSPPPLQPTRLLGSALELQMIEQRLVHDGVRLLSLCGPTGVGRTRLVLEDSLNV